MCFISTFVKSHSLSRIYKTMHTFCWVYIYVNNSLNPSKLFSSYTSVEQHSSFHCILHFHSFCVICSWQLIGSIHALNAVFLLGDTAINSLVSITCSRRNQSSYSFTFWITKTLQFLVHAKPKCFAFAVISFQWFCILRGLWRSLCRFPMDRARVLCELVCNWFLFLSFLLVSFKREKTTDFCLLTSGGHILSLSSVHLGLLSGKCWLQLLSKWH